MKISGKMLMLACLTAATASTAQGVNASTTAPSSVNEMAPLIQPLAGTLFFDQRQRDQMDRARKRGVVSIDDVSGEPAVSVLNGFVKRSDGQITIWVDGQPRSDVRSSAVRELQPQDVGGSSDTIKVLDMRPKTNLSMRRARQEGGKKKASSKTAAKPGAKK